MSALLQFELSQMVVSTRSRNGNVATKRSADDPTTSSALPKSPPPLPQPRSTPRPNLIFQEVVSPSVKEFLISRPLPLTGLTLLVLILLALPAVMTGSKSRREVIQAYHLTLNWIQQEVAVFKIVIPCTLILAMALWSLCHSVWTESVMFIMAVGVQVKQLNIFGGTISTRFFPKSKIKALVINETIRRQRVVTYLALILNTPDENGRIIIPLFHKMLPRLSLLTKVYSESYALLNT